MKPTLNAITLAIVIVIVLGLYGALRAGMTASQIVVLSSAAVAAAAQLSKLVEHKDDGSAPPPAAPPPPPPPGPTLLVIFALVVLPSSGELLTGCFPEAKEAVAAGDYEEQQMRCVQQYTTKAEIDRCRMRVKLAWSTTDAGADAEGGSK